MPCTQVIGGQAAASPHWQHGEEFNVGNKGSGRSMAVLKHPASGRSMVMYTDQPTVRASATANR